MSVKKLKNKVAIITGGVHGIGRATADKFVKEGAKVIIWDIDKSGGEKVVADFKQHEYEIGFALVDTTKYNEVEAAALAAYARHGKIDILINNAGITKHATMLNMTLEQWQEVIDVNLTGVFNCTKAAAAHMLKNKYGRIINTSSLVGIFGSMGQKNYTAAKSGIVGITKVWSRELSRYGITVNAVIPGFIETESIKSIPQNIVKSIKDKIPVGRIGLPEDVANAFLFLSSQEASYISGAILSVDGGYIS